MWSHTKKKPLPACQIIQWEILRTNQLFLCLPRRISKTVILICYRVSKRRFLFSIHESRFISKCIRLVDILRRKRPLKKCSTFAIRSVRLFSCSTARTVWLLRSLNIFSQTNLRGNTVLRKPQTCLPSKLFNNITLQWHTVPISNEFQIFR